MARDTSFPIPRRGEIRYALARAAAILSSLLLLSSAAPLRTDSFSITESTSENVRKLSTSIKRDVNIYITASLRHAIANQDPQNLRQIVRPNEDVSTYVITTPSSSASPSVSVVPSISPSPTTSASPSISTSPSPSATPSVSLSPSISATPSVSASPSTSASPTTSASPSVSTTPTISPSPSALKAPTVASGSENHVFIDLTDGSGSTPQSQPPVGTSNARSPLESLEPLSSFIPPNPDNSPESDERPLPSPFPLTSSATPSPIVWVDTQPIPVTTSTAPTATSSPSPSVSASAFDPIAITIQGMPKPKAGQNIVVFPILFQGSRVISTKLDQCIRTLAAKRTNTTPQEWSLVGVRNGTTPGEIEARYARSFSKTDTGGVREFETYVKQSMSKDISNRCNINDVSIVGAGSIIAAVGVAPVVQPGGVDRTIALASSLGCIALVMIVAGVLAVVYSRRRGNDNSDDFYDNGSFSDTTDANNVPHVRPGLRFSSSRDTGPGPHTLVEAMGGLPIREIPVSEEGETVTTDTYTNCEDSRSTSIYDEEEDDRSMDFQPEGPSQHSLQSFTGAWGALAPGARSVSEPDLDEDESDAQVGEEGDQMGSGTSTDGFDDGGFPEAPLSNSIHSYGWIAGKSESFRHPHDYLIGIGPTNERSPLPPPDYVMVDLEQQG